MTRPLLALSATDPAAVFTALRAALAGDGPAILPYATVAPVDLPAEVARRVALVVETSGSSGAPKRVALSSNALLASAAASDSALGGPGQWLLALPVHYIAGLNVLIRSITAQTEPVTLGPGPFTAADFVHAASGMERGVRQYTSVVPVQLSRLVAAAEMDPQVASALRAIDRFVVGGQSTPPSLLARATALGLTVIRSYGSSETAGGCVYNGRGLGGVSIRLRAGQIELGGPTLAEGYLGDEERTAASFYTDEHGARWYLTGDGGEFLPDTGTDTGTGTDILSVTGRLDRVIISGGIKVSLDAVERVLGELAGWTDAVALSEPDPEWGERATIVRSMPRHHGTVEPAFAGDASSAATGATEARAVTPEAVSRALVAALGRAAAPARVVTVDAIPTLPSGKPDRIAVRALISG